MKKSTLCLVVGTLGLIIASALGVRVLAQHGWDPTIFASFGEQAVEITEYAEEQLSREVILRDTLGHDGKYFFVLANDPWLTSPDEHAVVMDRPRYRAQRMLYPAVASGGGLFEPNTVIWSLLVVNLIAMGLGTWGVAQLASDMGGSPWLGLAFVLNVGLISEQDINGAGIVAAAAAFWAVLMLRRGRIAWATALLTLAALSREAMLIAAVGAGYWLWRQGQRRRAAYVSGVPVALVGLWAMFVRLRLGFGGDGSEIQEIGLPFVGVIQAVSNWMSDPVDLAVGLAILILLALFTRRAIMSDEPVGWVFLGFVPLAILFTRQVWSSYFDISRAVAPILTAFFLLVFTTPKRSNVESAASVTAT